MSARTRLSVLVTTAALVVTVPAAGALAASDAGGGASSAPTSADFAPGVVLVKYRDGVDDASQRALEQGQGAERRSEIAQLGVQVLSVPSGAEERVVRALSHSGKVAYAERDGVTAADAVPNDSLWSRQWGPAKVRLPEMWETTRGSSSVVVAVLDTGVDGTHPDLAGRVLTGYDFVNADADADDDHGHGTRAAGVAAAVTNNSSGVAGACWTCSILPVKVLNASNSGTMSGLAKGITYATDRGAHVISMSLSGTSASTSVRDAVRYAEGRGSLLVAAAGNSSSSDPRYPASFPEVLSVAGTQSNDTLYSWSSFGSTVDVAAPGCNETTTLDGKYTSFCGTSSATPLVAGTAAALFASRSGSTGTDVVAALRDSAVRIAADVTYGRIDSAAALTLLGGTTTSTEPQPAPEPSTEPAPEPTATETTTTFSGSLNNKNPSRSYDWNSPSAGTMTAELAYSKAPSMTLRVLDGSGNVIASATGGSPVSLSTPVAVGGYVFEVSGATRGSFTVTVVHRSS